MARVSRVYLAAGAAALVAGVWGGSALWRASRALGEAEQAQREAAVFRFDTRAMPRPGRFEHLGAPAAFHDAVIFQNRIFVCGSAGLFEYDLEGRKTAEHRVGERLPPAPLVGAAPGLTSLASAPELWIATAGEGLVSFDGERFRHIRPVAAEHRKMTSIIALPSGRLLISTEKAGVLVFDGQTLGPFHASLSGMHVTALAADDANVWAGTMDRGVLHWRGGQVRTYSTENGLPDARVLSLAAHEGSAYAGTALGVAVIRDNRVERTIGPGVFARAVHAGAGGRLLVGTQDEGVFEFPAGGSRRKASRVEGTGAPVERLVELRGSVYALTRDGMYDVRTWERSIAPEPSMLADGNIAALAAEGNGRVWVGYFDRGLDVVEGGRARHIEDEHVFCVNRIVHAPEQGGWAVATANGLVLMDEQAGKRQVLGRAQGLIASHVTDVAAAGGGLIAATPAGLTFTGKDGPRSLYAFHGLVNNHVYALAVSGGRVLAGTLGGVSVLEGEFVKANYTTANSPLRHNWVSAIAASGRDWFVGTYGSGVYRLRGDGGWETFADMPAGVVVNPNAMAVGAGRVYAGTLGQGLLVYEESAARWRGVTDGLPSLNVTAVSPGGGYLYVGTDNGLVRVAEREL